MAALASRVSSEAPLRALDALTSAEFDIRASAQPPSPLDVAPLRWPHLPRLLPLSGLIQRVEKGAPAPRPSSAAAPRTTPASPPGPKAPAPERSVAPPSVASPAAPAAARPAARPEPAAPPSGDLQPVAPAQ